MAVSRYAQTLMAPFSVPVDMGSVLAVMGGAVMVSVLLRAACKYKLHNPLYNNYSLYVVYFIMGLNNY